MSQPPHFFIAIYEGHTVCEARIVGATTDQNLVRMVFRSLAGTMQPDKQRSERKKQNRGKQRRRIL